MLALVLFLALTGTVKTVDGAPISGATIVISQSGRTLTATSDDHGAFTLADVTLPAVIEVSAPGFATVRKLIDRSPVEVTLSPASIRESVIVSAASATSPWRDGATGQTILPAADLEKVPAVTLDEGLRLVSGVSLFRRTSARESNPTTHGVTMRGLSASGSSRGLVLLDGVPLNDGFGGWVTWTRLPNLAVDRVEVDRGAEGETFGTDALGGVIGIVTPSISRSLMTASAQLGSQGVGGADISGGDTRGRLAMFGTAGWWHTSGFIPLDPVSRGPADQPADADWINGFGRATASWTNRRVIFSGWGGRDDRGNGTVKQRNRISGGTFATSFETVGAATTMSARVAVTPNRFYQTFSSVITSGGVARAAENLTSTQYIDNTTTRVLGEINHVVPRGYVGARVALSRASADFLEVKPASTVDQDLIDNSSAVSTQAAFTPFAHLTFGGGVRQEWRAAPTTGTANDAATVGRITSSWRASDRVTVRGSLATSHRWATLNELVRGFQVGAIVTQANPALNPERGRSADGAVTFRAQRWEVTGGAFWSVVHDAIANVTIGTNLRQRQNAGEAHARGAEMDVALRPTSFLRVRTSATFSDATFQHSLEPLLEGRRLPQVPRLAGSLSADATLPRKIIASLVWRSISSQFDDDRNAFLLTDATQFDLRIAGQERRFGWYLDTDNLFNNRIETGKTPLITLAPGRAVRVGFSWRR